MSILKYQLWHLFSLFILISLAYLVLKGNPLLLQGSLFGIETSIWLLFAILIPVLHQAYVMICWRTELLHNSMSRLFGENGFKVFKIGFAVLFFSRLISIIILALSNADSLDLNHQIGYLIGTLLFIPSGYLFYSVKKYFGMDRAFGIDHFDIEIYKDKEFVKQGIFRYSSNAMYVFGFFILWIPGFFFLSQAALVAALFNHLFIWAHYYFTELPDIKFIYHK